LADSKVLVDERPLQVGRGLSGALPSIRATAPEFGQHTKQILVYELGMSWEEVGILKEKGIV
jgi:crotonobetainyl-CoA:carnitine CoA-transferase CaiB-like acyl-CoA transferase